MDKEKFVNHLEEMVVLLKEKKYKRRWKNEYIKGCINTLTVVLEDVEDGKFDPREKPIHSLYNEIFTYVMQGRKVNNPRLNPETDPGILDVVGYSQQIWPDKTAREWLFGNNDYLEGARPIDFLVLGKTREVMEALELEKA